MQPTTTVELFFDLVYVFAVTQLSHQILDDLSVAGVARASFLLLVVWWAWIYTTWMANWFDPASSAVRAVLTAVMLASLLMAAALPGALAGDGALFAASYVSLQVGRNAAAAFLLPRGHPLRDVFERLVVWSAVSGVLWLVGGFVESEQRLALWLPALALELAAPAAGYWRPGGGRAATTDYDVEGGHFAERCQLFIIIALGESIVVTGATASAAGLSSTVVLCLIIAFVGTAALSLLYFGATSELARAAMTSCEDPAASPRRLYVSAPADHRRDHRDRGRQRPAHRASARAAARRRPRHDARRARALPARREPLPPADSWTGERGTPGRRRAVRRADCGRRPAERAAAQRDRRHVAVRACGLGVASA
jgi:low temperature requirement protein LtrA